MRLFCFYVHCLYVLPFPIVILSDCVYWLDNKKTACGVVPFWGACLQAVDWRLLLQKLKLTVSMVYSYPLSMPFMFSESSLALLLTFFFGALAFMLPKFHVSERFTVRPLRQFFW